MSSLGTLVLNNTSSSYKADINQHFGTILCDEQPSERQEEARLHFSQLDYNQQSVNTSPQQTDACLKLISYFNVFK